MSKLAKNLAEAFNEQVQTEISSAYLYLAMSALCESMSFKGAASWLRHQWSEELGHALRLVDYMHDRGNRLVLHAIPEPRVEHGSLLDVFTSVLEHEKQVSESINQLYGLAAKESDFAAQAFLQWYVSEQVEEESTANDIVEMLRLAGDESSVLLMVDRQLAERSSGGDADDS